MSIEVRLKVKAQIDSEAAEFLCKFVNAWEHGVKLEEAPSEDYLKLVSDNLAHIFFGNYGDLFLERLADDFLDLDAEFKTHDDDVEIFFNRFLSVCVRRFIGGSIHYLDFSDKPQPLVFDEKKRQFLLP